VHQTRRSFLSVRNAWQ